MCKATKSDADIVIIKDAVASDDREQAATPSVEPLTIRMRALDPIGTTATADLKTVLIGPNLYILIFPKRGTTEDGRMLEQF